MERKIFNKRERAMKKRALEPGEERIEEMAAWKVKGLRTVITHKMQAWGSTEPFRIIYFKQEGSGWTCIIRTKEEKYTFFGKINDLRTSVVPKKKKEQ